MAEKVIDVDVLLKILQDEECNSKLFEELKAKLLDNAVLFYANFVEPRFGKLAGAAPEVFARLTLVQEVQKMNDSTAPGEDT